MTVSDRGALSDEPALFDPGLDGRGPRPVAAWAGPWPVDERWWDPEHARRHARVQVVGVDGSAYLLLVADGTWRTEAVYD